MPAPPREPAREQVRAAAIRALTAVLSDHCTLEEGLARATQDFGALQGWLQDVCSGTLRWKGRLDLAIDSAALHKKPTGWLRKALLVAAYQLIAQERANAGAVVSETVDAVRKREGEAPARFANALCRKISAHATEWRDLAPPAGPKAGGKPDEKSTAEASARASLPPWLWRALERDHGREWAWNYACASLARPVTWLRTQGGEEWSPKLSSQDLGAEPGPVTGSWRLPSGSGAIPLLEGFEEGKFIVQDISSQILIARVTEEVKKRLGRSGGLTALDLCAAPGGKTVGLHWGGFEVCASDQDGARVALLQDTLKRVRLEKAVRCVARDQVGGLSPMDLVWVDAPCTGSGILRRHPEVRWLRQEKELAGLHKIQAELLTEGWARVKPGGFLAYSVCSVLKDEGSRQIERQSLGQVVDQWFLAPQEAPYGDGFWAALLQKPSE